MPRPRVTLIRGDGIGPEVVGAAVEVIEATGVEIDWEEVEAGGVAMEQYGNPLPESVLISLQETRVGLKGPLRTPVGSGYASLNVALRKAFDLYANVRPVRSFPGLETPFKSVDLVVVRENIQDLYAGLEQVILPGVATALKVVSEGVASRIAHFAFRYARTHNRHRVVAVHKANILKETDGLFLRCVQEVAREYPEIELTDLLVDNACLQLVRRPQDFEVIVTLNLYGDILSDLCAGLVGGLGVAEAANLGDDCAIFEGVHGTAPEIAGRNVANPLALILSAASMLVYLGEPEAGEAIRQAVQMVLEEGKVRTPDLAGTASTTEMTEAVCAALKPVGEPA